MPRGETMKIYYLLFLGLSPIYAEYTTEYLLEKGNTIYSETKAQTKHI
ncbi:hypothetical protein MNB_SV-13-2141 [hydrothermal vent metagenome]|uniref:Uncharacterized protein n=1 Tax=hydrothermal vent metagenome TaxID=652676 RepID=A0A1W1C6V2_9ZZZZ